MKVLIVEDSPEICERLRNMVAELENIELLADVDNEKDAIASICNQHPDTVILDLTLAQGSGIEVLKQVKQNNNCPCKIVILTNYAYPQYRKKCMQLGADYFLDKSLDLEMLGSLLADMALPPPQLSNCSNV